MDSGRFDHFTKAMARSTRRDLSRRALGGLAAIAFGLANLDEVDAKPQACNAKTCGQHGGKCCRRRRDRKKFCVKKSSTCCPAGDACAPPYPKCCPNNGRPRTARGLCTRKKSICCSRAQGNHACPSAYPVCCPPRPGFPRGLCTRAGNVCCPVGSGTSCPANFPVCCPAVGTDPRYCCTSGSVCGVGGCTATAPSSLRAASDASVDRHPAASTYAR
jgi:hypothetical protein